MKTAKKVLSILLAITMVLSMLTVAVSANGNKETANYQVKVDLTAQKATYNWKGKQTTGRGGVVSYNSTLESITYDKTVSDPTGDNKLDVYPGDTVVVRLYLTNNYYAGQFMTPIFYSSDLGDAKDVFDKSLVIETPDVDKSNFKISDKNIEQMAKFNSNNGWCYDDPDFGQICNPNAQTSMRTIYSQFNNDAINLFYASKDSKGENYFTMVQNPNYKEAEDGENCKWFGQTPDGKTWACTFFSISPETNLEGNLYTLPLTAENGCDQWLLEFPVTIPANATAGQSYEVMIPEQIIRGTTVNQYGRLVLGYVPDGQLYSNVLSDMSLQCFDEDQYFDLSGAKVTLNVVENPSAQLTWENLQKAYDSASALKAENYTSDSWAEADLATVLASAKTELDNKTATTQPEINAYKINIDNALKKLVEKADYSLFNTVYAQAKALNKDEYTAASWSASSIDELMNTASTLSLDLAKTTPNQNIINSLTTSLENAIQALAKKADYSALNTAIGSAESFINTHNESDYTVASWSALTTAYNNGKAVDKDLADNVINNAKIADLTEAINNALENMTLKSAYKNITYSYVSSTGANMSAAVASNTNPTQFLPAEGATISEDAITIADAYKTNYKIVSVDPTTIPVGTNTDKTVTVVIDLKDADYTALNQTIAAAEAIVANPGTYDTQDSTWTAFTQAIENAKNVNKALKINDQNIIDGLKNAIINAQSVLKFTGANYAALNNLIATIPASFSTNPEWYDGVAAVQNFIDTYKKDYDVEHQADVDALVVELTGLLANLKLKKADVSELETALTNAARIYNNPSIYDETYYAGLKADYETAKAYVDAKNTDDAITIDKQVSVINALVTSFNSKIASPVYAAYDYTDINAMINNWKALGEAKYTAASWANVKAKADAVPQNLTMSVADRAKAGLWMGEFEELVAALVEKADYSAVNAILSDRTNYVFEVDEKYYVGISEFDEYAKTLNMDLSKKEQNTVDGYANELQTLYDAIEIGSYTINYKYFNGNTEITTGISDTNAKTVSCDRRWAYASNKLSVDGYTYESADPASIEALDKLPGASVDVKVNLKVAGVDVTYNYVDAKGIDMSAFVTENANPTFCPVTGLTIEKDLITLDSDYEVDTINPPSIPAGVDTAQTITVVIKLKGADYSALDAALDAAGKLNSSDYTLASWAVLDDAVKAGNALSRELTILSQDDVDAAAKAINDAIKALKTLSTDVVEVTSEPQPIWNPASYDVKIEGRAIKVRFDDATNADYHWTFDRTKIDEKNITSYDKYGNPVHSDSRLVAYEVWHLENVILPAGDYKAIAKYSVRSWVTDESRFFDFTVTNKLLENTELKSAKLDSEYGPCGSIGVTVVVGADVEKVQLELNGTTVTITNAKDNGDGTKTFKGSIRANVYGDNVIYINTKVNNEWNNKVTSLVYYGF